MVTIGLVVITCLISMQAFSNPSMKAKLLHRPVEEHRDREYYRLLTHGFIHADYMHLGINMYVLWVFGRFLETVFVSTLGEMKGRIAFLVMYITTIIAASLYTHFKHKNNYSYAALGASGATSGIVFAFVLFNPWEWFIIPPAPAIIAAVLYLWYSSWASKNSRDNIGHDAHYWGAIYGLVFTILLNPKYLEYFFEQLQYPKPPPFF